MRTFLFFVDYFVKFQELCGRKFFGANRGGVVQELDGFLDLLFVVGAAERIGKGLALLGESGPHKVEESVGGLQGIGLGREQHGGAIHVGPWCKMLGPDFPEDLGVGVGGHQNGKASVVAAAGGGADALGYLQLDHAHEPFGQVQLGHEFCDDGGRNVVGEVPRDPGLFVGVQKGLQVELQEVDVLDVEVFAALEFLFQKFDALLVDFDGSELHGTVQQVLCEGAVPRADFQHAVAFIGRQVPCNQLCGRDVQKVLAKFATAGSVHGEKDRKMTVGVRI